MLRRHIMKTGLEILHLSQAHRALEPICGGSGLFFTLHHVRPVEAISAGEASDFHPNGILEITPDFLDATIERVKALGLDLVSFEEAVARIRDGRTDRRFACFTLDDGYRDNLVHAAPVFRAHDCPFTVFVATSFPDGNGELWWQALEDAIAGNDEVVACIDGGDTAFPTRTRDEKQYVYDLLYGWLFGVDEDVQRKWMRDFAKAHGVDLKAICRHEAASWDEVRELAGEPLATIGAHTVNHFSMAKLPRQRALDEMVESRNRIHDETGVSPRFFCYPYGSRISAGAREFDLAREAGFDAAVTTRKGVVFPDHADHLHALPRVSLNGDFQQIRYIDLFVSGAAFAIRRGFRKVNAA